MKLKPSYRPGQEIPGANYRVTRVLGEGGHAFVYLCKHTVLHDSPAAVKVLHETYSNQPDLARRMRAEANILSQLHHPNLVTVRDAGLTTEASPRPYTVMEYLRGEPLSATIADNRNGVDLRWALQIVAEVTRGLTVAHKLGVIHRDIKPANIFLCRQPDDTDITKLIDFGVAAIASAARTTGRLFLGTIRYAPPEQLSALPPSAQTDLYALGMVLYELVCGRGPFDDIDPPDGMRQDLHSYRLHLTRIPPRARTLRPDIPLELDALIAQLLEKEPARRPASAALLEETLVGIAQRIEADRSATCDPNRTEPTPHANRMITFSATTEPLPVAADPVHDTAPDAEPMGNRHTLRMHPTEPSDPSDLSDLGDLLLSDPRPQPPNVSATPATWHPPPFPKRTIRMATAPAHPAALADAIPPAPTATPVVTGPTIRMATAPAHPAALANAVPSAPPAAPVVTDPIARPPGTTLPGPPPIPPPARPPILAPQAPPPSLAHSRQPPSPTPPRMPTPAPHLPPEPSAPPGLVLPTITTKALLRVAHNRTWQLAAGGAVTILLLLTVWTTTRQPRFVPPPPPAWLTAQPTAPTPSAIPDAPPASPVALSPIPPPDSPDPDPPAAGSAPPSPRPTAAPAPRRMQPVRPPGLPGFKTTFH